jgi:hypothetical protein
MTETPEDKALNGSAWANRAMGDLMTAASALKGVGHDVAYDIAQRPESHANSFLVAGQAVEDAWDGCCKALKTLGRARAFFADARETASREAADHD